MSAPTTLSLHLLLAVPPHNMNRDEDGRPKTVVFGEVLRGRISSQARKRALRFFPDFPEGLRAVRTRELGIAVYRRLKGAGFDEDLAKWAALAVNAAAGESVKFPSLENEDKQKDANKQKDAKKREVEREQDLRSPQGLVVSQRELRSLEEKLARLLAGEKSKQAVKAWVEDLKENGLLCRDEIDLDIALFGRMVAARPEFNVEAAASVAHALTTHAFAVEADYFSAGEELNMLGETGAAITSYAFFGAGVYYQHASLHLPLFRDNLSKGRPPERVEELVDEGVRLLLRGLAFALPGGKRGAFAHHSPAVFALADLDSGPALNLATAFLEPVRADEDRDLASASIERLRCFHTALRRSYGLDGTSFVFNAWPPARAGNEPPEGEFWTWKAFEDAVAAAVRSAEA
ncbi:CRISPR system Cascade subunit CasC [bacterium HR39]|nr:CRISPR system Cascade subunit CasC [bacterium HR39]